MFKATGYIVVSFFIVSAVYAADIKVEEQIVQKGLFAKADCTSDPTDPAYDACTCDADIRAPHITGMIDTNAQAALNKAFIQDAEHSKCEGEAVKEQAKDNTRDPSSASHHYDITFQSPTLLAFEFTDWGYTGGAHGNGTVSGVIIDLTKGKFVTLGDLFAAKDISVVNDAIYATLSAKPEEEVFRDQVESRKGAFIKDGVCEGCTLILKPDGIKVVFQTYEVAPYAVGNMEVPIPIKYVSYPAIAQAVSEKK